jgi:hypothetical protein
MRYVIVAGFGLALTGCAVGAGQGNRSKPRRSGAPQRTGPS